jgi:hypothetical protein
MVVAHELTIVGTTPCFTYHSRDVEMTPEMQPEETSTSRKEFCKNNNYLVNKCESNNWYTPWYCCKVGTKK